MKPKIPVMIGLFILISACVSENASYVQTDKCPCMPGTTYTCHCSEDGDDVTIETGSRFCTKRQVLTECVCAADRHQEPLD